MHLVKNTGVETLLWPSPSGAVLAYRPQQTANFTLGPLLRATNCSPTPHKNDPTSVGPLLRDT